APSRTVPSPGRAAHPPTAVGRPRPRRSSGRSVGDTRRATLSSRAWPKAQDGAPRHGSFLVLLEEKARGFGSRSVDDYPPSRTLRNVRCPRNVARGVGLSILA